MPNSEEVIAYWHALIESAEPLFDAWGYPVVFVAIFIEGMGIPAPGLSLLLVGLLFAEASDGNMGLLLVASMAFIAASIGNLIGYTMGYQGIHRILVRWGIDKHLQRIETLFQRYGAGIVLFGRFLDILRQLNGIACGVLEMPFWKFFIYNLIGAILWVGFWTLLVLAASHNSHTLAIWYDNLAPYWPVFIVLFIAIIIAVILLKMKRPKMD